MLVLSRRTDETIMFPSVGIALKVLKVRGQIVKLGIEAPADIEVCRPDAKHRPQGPPRSRRRLDRHDLRGRVNNVRLALAVFDRQRALGMENEAEQTFQRLLTLLAELDAQLSRADDTELAEKAPEANGRLRLLVVDDEDNERELLAGLLRLYGYDVAVAADGREALDLLETCGPPDVVLLDVNMPNKNGLEVVKQIRSDSRFSDLPVFAVSGRDPASVGTQAELSRFNGWFPKPVDPTRLLAAINASHHARTIL
jgi:carbon storage regulator CsrA